MTPNQIRVFKDTKKRANEFAAYTDANGTSYPWVPRDLLEIVDLPQPPADFSDELYFRTEQDDAPYVVYTRKSDEQIEQARKSKIQNKVDELERSAMMPRVTREYMLLQMEAMFTPEQLSQNYGYRKVKEFDNEISALRASL